MCSSAFAAAEQTKNQKLGTVIGIDLGTTCDFFSVRHCMRRHQIVMQIGTCTVRTVRKCTQLQHAAAAAIVDASKQSACTSESVSTTDNVLTRRYSVVGVYKNGRAEIIANDLGDRITPSYVSFTNTERLIGQAAKSQATVNPNSTIYDVKRLVGRQCALLLCACTLQSAFKLGVEHCHCVFER